MAHRIDDEIAPLTYTAAEVATLTGFPRPTVYDRARQEPKLWGVIRVGTAIRFRRDAIHALLAGVEARPEQERGAA